MKSDPVRPRRLMTKVKTTTSRTAGRCGRSAATSGKVEAAGEARVGREDIRGTTDQEDEAEGAITAMPLKAEKNDHRVNTAPPDGVGPRRQVKRKSSAPIWLASVRPVKVIVKFATPFPSVSTSTWLPDTRASLLSEPPVKAPVPR